MGPRYNRDNYDPENGKGLEYLFIKNSDPNSKKRAKFIPIQSLNEGVLAIYVQKGTLAYALNYGEGNVLEDDIKKIKKEVYDSVFSYIQENFVELYDILPNSNDSAIIIDLRKNNGKRKFAKLYLNVLKKPLRRWKIKEIIWKNSVFHFLEKSCRISGFKQSVAKKTGIPTTKSGMERKIGRTFIQFILKILAFKIGCL